MTTNEEKEAGIISALAAVNNDIFKVKGVNDVNYSLGHPYTIGPRHVKFASDNYGGSLGEAAIEAGEAQGIRCAHPKCGESLKEHTSDKICFLQLVRNAAKDDAGQVLKGITEILGPKYIDGFAFVETAENFNFDG